jgi:hypothetical protein
VNDTDGIYLSEYMKGRKKPKENNIGKIPLHKEGE